MKSENPPILLAFLDCFALAVAFRGLSCVCRLGYCLGCFAPVVCGFRLGCVVGVSFSLRMIATKRKGEPLGLVLSSWVVGCFIWLLLCTPRARQYSGR